MTSPFPRGVLIVGTGLLGTSIGMALRRLKVDVWLRDNDPLALTQAIHLAAGVPDSNRTQPASLAVVAVPPRVTGRVVTDILRDNHAEYVTDVASVKELPASQVSEWSDHGERYVPGHPMAGREISGPRAALPNLFEGRPWVLCPTEATEDAAVAAVRTLVEYTKAEPVFLTPQEHDSMVAIMSHAPHVVASLMAGRLREAAQHQVNLAGQGIADVTRVASGDPTLWTQILTTNAAPVRRILAQLRDDLDRTLLALKSPDSEETELEELLRHGVQGRSRLPGKRGVSESSTVVVVVDDRPGQLARLFADVEDTGVNVEDLRIEHSPHHPVGLVEIEVATRDSHHLTSYLAERGWRSDSWSNSK